jgi:hypothetical protein
VPLQGFSEEITPFLWIGPPTITEGLLPFNHVCS